MAPSVMQVMGMGTLFDVEAFYRDEFWEACGYFEQGILLRACAHQAMHGSVPRHAFRALGPRGTPEECSEFLDAWDRLIEAKALLPFEEQGTASKLERLVVAGFDQLVTLTACHKREIEPVELPLLGTHGAQYHELHRSQPSQGSELADVPNLYADSSTERASA